MTIISTLFLISSATVYAADPIRFGFMSSKPSKAIKTFTPLMKYLTSKGLTTSKIVVAKNIDDMTKKLNENKVDFVFQSAYGAILLMDKTGAVPILNREKGGVKAYNSAIFVNKNSPIKSMEELVGKVIAFEDPGSTSSYRLPRGIFDNAGISLNESRKPAPGVVSYYFSKDDNNTIAQVKAGKRVDAGGIKRTEVSDNPDFRILKESPYVPRYVVLLRKGFDGSQLEKILLGMKEDPGAQDVLKKIITPTGFSTFDVDPVEYLNGEVRKALRL